MACIGWHKNSEAWVVAGWAFRQILEDVRSQCSTDKEMISELELARDLKYLFIDSFSPDLAKRLASAIRETASGIQSGKIRSSIFDKHGFTANDIAEYRESMRELIAVVSDDCSHRCLIVMVGEKSRLRSEPLAGVVTFLAL
jgi:hypothetical protein